MTDCTIHSKKWRINIRLEYKTNTYSSTKSTSFLFYIFSYFSSFSFHWCWGKKCLRRQKEIWKLIIFRTCIIHKLTASCLQLSFHLTFKFLVLQTDRQFFLFLLLLYLKCKTTIQSGHSNADYSILKSKDLTTKSCVSLSIWTF